MKMQCFKLTKFRVITKFRSYCVNQNQVTQYLNDTCVFDRHDNDVSGLASNHSQSFNLAAYVNTSDTLQKLMKLNVNLAKIEKKPYIAEKILKLDFESNIKNHIFFLKEYVENESLGIFLTRNPLILCQDIADLEVRINYLQSKQFNSQDIIRIISKNPFWLMFNTEKIDRRLGYFQNTFALTGNEVRFLATKQPRIITYNLHHISTNTFVIKEEFGFNDGEIKQLLLKKPKIWMMNQKSLLERFNYIHNVMKITHEDIKQNSTILTYRNFIVKQRHLFLEKLGRAQYNRKKPNYVPLTALCSGTDVEFCKKYAKCSVADFNIFLKTM
ncbi:transcription termination factor 3, mitochondrial [Pieris brassicae]|uniref:transcription termination factor 3, mitochondrial n=1 Tax=Pieris brassicae TaxID=7116 RepID=UPI001E66106F|nr:transcription termination factor 3, mitochondrial [Pieris brassicae]